MGSGTACISALRHERKFKGVEIDKSYYKIAEERIEKLSRNELKIRPHDQPIYEP